MALARSAHDAGMAPLSPSRSRGRSPWLGTLRLLLLGLLVAPLLVAAESSKPAASKEAEATEDEAAPVDPTVDAWRSYQDKRRLRRVTRAGTAEERSQERLNRLATPAPPPRPATPGAPTTPAAPASIRPIGGWLGSGANRFGYVRRPAASATRAGVVVLLDERARVPGEIDIFVTFGDELARHGFDVWSAALPDVATSALPRRTRQRFVAPVPAEDAEPAEELAEGDADAAAASAAAIARPAYSRRRWTAPGRPAAAVVPTPTWAGWRNAATTRLNQLVAAAQAEQKERPLPIVVVGRGLGANLVAATGQAQGVAGLVLLDLVAGPEGAALDPDTLVAALQAPVLAIDWRQRGVVDELAWLRLTDDTRVDLRGASAITVARRLRGWLGRSFAGR